MSVAARMLPTAPAFEEGEGRLATRLRVHHDNLSLFEADNEPPEVSRLPLRAGV